MPFLRRALFDGNGGGEALDVIDIGLLHQLEELPGVGGKAFDVASLAFRVQGVESQRGFARAA